MKGILAGLEKSSTRAINSFNNGFVKPYCRHKMEREGAKNSRSEDKVASSVEERGLPAREVAVTRSNNWLAI